MKKILTLIAALLCVTAVSAQVKGLQASFTHTKTAAGTTEKDSGKIYYSAPGSLALHYDAPSTNLVVIDGTAVFHPSGRQGTPFRHHEECPDARHERNASQLRER